MEKAPENKMFSGAFDPVAETRNKRPHRLAPFVISMKL
jgi:hypothetical protein